MADEPDPPPQPDYAGLSASEAAENRRLQFGQNVFNRPGQTTPFSNTSWDFSQTIQDPEGNTHILPQQTETLDPTLQGALDAQFGATKGRSEQAQGLLGQVDFTQPFDYSGFQDFGAPVGNANQTIEGEFERLGELQAPIRSERQSELDTQLANKGITEGSTAYNKEQRRLSDQFNRDDQANYGAAIQQAGNVQGLDLNSSNYSNALRQSQVAEGLQSRARPLNEVNALLTGQQVSDPSQPSFAAGGQARGANQVGAAQLAYGSQLDAFNAQQAGQQSQQNAILGLAGTAAQFLI